MKPLFTEDLIEFLKASISSVPDPTYDESYRAAVTLIDGVYLPCVVFRCVSKRCDLALRRFEEAQSGKGISNGRSTAYKEIVKSFVASGNRINSYDIAEVHRSNFAIPGKLLQQIQDETSMGWTGFVAKMKDGKHFAFGTAFSVKFFHMPEGYSPDDIVDVINHSYIDKDGNCRSYHDNENVSHFDMSLVFRERPYFECYLDNL